MGLNKQIRPHHSQHASTVGREKLFSDLKIIWVTFRISIEHKVAFICERTKVTVYLFGALRFNVSIHMPIVGESFRLIGYGKIEWRGWQEPRLLSENENWDSDKQLLSAVQNSQLNFGFETMSTERLVIKLLKNAKKWDDSVLLDMIPRVQALCVRVATFFLAIH